MTQRSALVIASDVYAHPTLRALTTVVPEAAGVYLTLVDRGDFAVAYESNTSAHELRARIAAFFARGQPDDQLLLYLSAHGFADAGGERFFATVDTDPGLRHETAVSETFLEHCLASCHSRRIVLLLDCSLSGSDAARALPSGPGRLVIWTFGSIQGGRSSVRRATGFGSAIEQALRLGLGHLDSIDGLYGLYVAARRRVRQRIADQEVWISIDDYDSAPLSGPSGVPPLDAPVQSGGRRARPLSGRVDRPPPRRTPPPPPSPATPPDPPVGAPPPVPPSPAGAPRPVPPSPGAAPPPVPPSPAGAPRPVPPSPGAAPPPVPPSPAGAPRPVPPSPGAAPPPVPPSPAGAPRPAAPRPAGAALPVPASPAGAPPSPPASSPGGRLPDRDPATGLQLLRRTPHMDVGASRPVPAGAIFGIFVYCDTQSARDGEVVQDVAVLAPRAVVEFPMQVWVAGSEHFKIARPVRTLVLRRDRPGSERVAFEVAVVADPPPGPAQLTAVFSHAGRPCGQVTRMVTLASDGPARPSGTPSPRHPGGRIVAREDAQQPDVVVEVKAVSGNEREFACRVVTRLLDGHDRPGPEPWHLQSRAPDLVASYMEDFAARGLTDGERLSRLKGAGMALWSAAPESFTRLFWRLVDEGRRPRSILVVSDEWSFPWELMVPFRGRGGQREVRRPLGVDFQIGRWVTGDMTSPAQHIALDAGLVLAPAYEQPHTLRHAAAEARYVCEHLGGRLVQPGSYDALESAFARRPVPLVHFVCHGATSTTQSQALMLEGGARLLSHQLPAMPALSAAVAAGQPLVFLNACEVGRGQPALVRVGGFASAFIDLGAQCVLAPLWSVDDAVAHEVAQDFYAQILARPGTPFAQILQGIRARAYGPRGADTHAAYCLYGDPLARASASR